MVGSTQGGFLSSQNEDNMQRTTPSDFIIIIRQSAGTSVNTHRKRNSQRLV